jgi:hypothetical protein
VVKPVEAKFSMAMLKAHQPIDSPA